MTAETLIDHYLDLIEASRRWDSPSLAREAGDPAFFFDRVDFDLADHDYLLPFDQLWLVIVSTKIYGMGERLNLSETSTIATHLKRGDDLKSLGWYLRHKEGWWTDVPMTMPHQDKLGFEAVIVAALRMITGHERETVETDRLRTVNAGRAKSKTPIAPIPPFIALGGPLRVNDGTNPTETTNGSPRAPHDRRAHYRTLKSGRRIPVKSSRIHGGATTPRHYTVH